MCSRWMNPMVGQCAPTAKWQQGITANGLFELNAAPFADINRERRRVALAISRANVIAAANALNSRVAFQRRKVSVFFRFLIRIVYNLIDFIGSEFQIK